MLFKNANMNCEQNTRIEQLYGPQRNKNVSSNIFAKKDSNQPTHPRTNRSISGPHEDTCIRSRITA